MKIKSMSGVFGLWCAFLAAGTWILPMGGFLLLAPTSEASPIRAVPDESDALQEAQQLLSSLLAEGAFDRAPYISRDVDLSADGEPESIEVTPSPALGGAGAIRVIDGATGAERYSIRAMPGEHLFGEVVGVLDDLDGDGHRELLIVSSHHLQNGFRLIGRLHSGRTGRLVALVEDVNEIDTNPQLIPEFAEADTRIAADVNADQQVDLTDVAHICSMVCAPGNAGIMRVADSNQDAVIDGEDIVSVLQIATEEASEPRLAALVTEFSQVGEVTLLAPPGSGVTPSSTGGAGGGGGGGGSVWVGGIGCAWSAAKLIATTVFMLAQLVACGSQTAAGLPCWINLACRVAQAINRLLEFLNTCYVPPPAAWIAGAHGIITVATAICQLFTGDFAKMVDWLKGLLRWLRGNSAVLSMSVVGGESFYAFSEPSASERLVYWARVDVSGNWSATDRLGDGADFRSV